MMMRRHTLLAAAALSLFAASASAVDWGGYVRIGPGQKENDGPYARCFGGGGADGDGTAAPGHGGIGRLGNECNVYGEFGLSQSMNAGGVDYKALLMTNFYQPGSDAAEITTGVEQIYLEGKGFDIAPQQTFWIGDRFYHRADVHLDDSFYVNMSGTGAGVDGITPGVGSLSLAVFREGDASSLGVQHPGTRYNADWENIDTNPGGKLRLTMDFTDFKGVGGHTGWAGSIQHNQSGFLGGDNTLWLQYAEGSANVNMAFGNPTDDSDRKLWRIADSVTWVNGPLSGQALVHYGHGDRSDGLGGTLTTSTWSGVGRAAYAMTKNFKLQGELGYADTKPAVGPDENVMKFTIAPTLTVGPKYYDRPELRFYYSFFSMNDAYQLANGQSKKNVSAVGFQLETWF
jgi:maltoporin